MSSLNLARTSVRAVVRVCRASSSKLAPLQAGRAQLRHHQQAVTTLASKRFATSDASALSAEDPAESRSLDLMEEGTRKLEDGDVEGAKEIYKRSLEVKKTSAGLFNLGVCEYHLKNNVAAIEAWKLAIEISPSADAHTNLASAYILSNPPQPALAIQHLTSALALSPEDPEIAFNLAAVLESTGNLDPALTLYKKAAELGIDRAEQNIRNVSAKLLQRKVDEQAKAKSS